MKVEVIVVVRGMFPSKRAKGIAKKLACHPEVRLAKLHKSLLVALKRLEERRGGRKSKSSRGNIRGEVPPPLALGPFWPVSEIAT